MGAADLAANQAAVPSWEVADLHYPPPSRMKSKAQRRLQAHSALLEDAVLEGAHLLDEVLHLLKVHLWKGMGYRVWDPEGTLKNKITVS